MFSFLNSTILFAAAAALIPLIIHLFSRRRVKVIEFSSLKHLKSMQKRQVRRLKIRQLLLLMLRMAIILAVVMAFARPTTKGGAVGSHASVSAVVLFDNSASMSRYVTDGNLFEIARQRTHELLQTFGQSDQVALIPLVETDQPVIVAPSFGSAAVASEQLDMLQPGYGKADLESALEYGVKLIDGARNLNREIYFVTDRQRNSLPENKLLEGTNARVYMVDLPLEENENCGIVSVDFGGQLIQPGVDFNIVATVRNYGTENKKDMIGSLFLDGSRVSQTDFTVASGADAGIRFTRSVLGTGFHSGYVEISDDKFMADNRYYFSFRIPDRFNLLIISGDDAAPYAALALVPNQTLSQYWSVKQATPAELSGVNFLDYDVVMLIGAPSLSSTYIARLKSFVDRGKSLFISYGKDTDINAFNAAWSDITGVVYDEAAPRTFTRAGYYSLQSVDTDHPIFSVFDFEKNKPPQVKFFALPKLHVTGDVRKLMVFTGNRPALVEARRDRGKVITFTGPMSPEYTDLPGHSFFVPFISRLAEYLASDLSTFDLHLYAGESISRSLSSSGPLNYPVDLVAPDSSRYSLPPEEDKGTLVLRVKPTDLPGIYHVNYLGHEIDRFAVNISPGEGNLAEADVDQYSVAVGADKLDILETEEPLKTAIAGFRFGRELWQVFLWLAVLFVILEMLLARGTKAEE